MISLPEPSYLEPVAEIIVKSLFRAFGWRLFVLSLLESYSVLFVLRFGRTER